MKNFLIYKSSAGSGKTYTLVKEYLKIVLRDPDAYRQTLAVTFTNKAAEEMKNRIISKLRELSEGKDEALTKTLAKEGVNGNIPLLASQVLSSILHDYSYFSVSTIDSFFHKVIRSFARELKLQLGYGIELDTEAVLDKITDAVFDRISEDETLGKYIQDFVFYNIDDKGDWRIDYKLRELSKEIFKERYWEKKETDSADVADNRETMQQYIGQMFAIVKTFEKKMNEISVEAEQVLHQYKVTAEDFPYKGAGFVSYLVSSLRKKNYEPGKRARGLIDDHAKWLPKKPATGLKEAVDGGLADLLEDAIKLYDKDFRNYYTAKELTRTIYVLGIFNDFLERLKEYREENKVLLISDTNNLLKKIISGESSPFIYEKTGSTYKNFLIDEFQDTSNYQWDNFRPLVQNSLSEGGFSMIVGDVKQSIYRWRSGNMKLLLEKVRQDMSAFNELTEENKLEDNRRSSKDVIKFNNDFFQKASALVASKNAEYSKLITDSYNETNQSSDFAPAGGYVNIEFVPYEKGSELSGYDRADALIIQRVKEALVDGFELRDIMVLTRKVDEGSRAASLLMDSGYPVVSSDSLLLNTSPKVKLIISLLEYINDSKNEIAKSQILYDYQVYIKNNDAELNSLFADHKHNNNFLFRSSLPAEFFDPDSSAPEVNPHLLGLGLYELAEKLISIFSLGTQADPYLFGLLDAIMEFSRTNTASVPDFLEWWSDNSGKLSIVVPGDKNAIRVLTIHKAKGLESPVVIIPYANWEMDNRNTSYLWVSTDEKPFNESSAYLVKSSSTLEKTYFDKDYEEEKVLTNIDNLNLLYVSFTRAAKRLYVICLEKGSNSYNTSKLIKDVIGSGEHVISFGKRSKISGTDKPTGINSLSLSELKAGTLSPKAIYQPRRRSLLMMTNESVKQKIKRGLLLHEALSHIVTAKDIDKAVSILIRDGLISISDADELKKELIKIISFADAKDWFSGKYKVKRESIILRKDKALLRPDRVLLDANKAIVVDFKSGGELAEHKSQLNEYADALVSAGYDSVYKYLYYITLMKVVQV